MNEEVPINRQFESYFGGLRIGVLDIETTGLDRWKNEFILGGLYDVSEGLLHQVFAQNNSEEAEALEAFAEILEPMDVVITYNGRKFDMPFLEERAVRNFGTAEGGSAGMRDPMPMPYDLDLYRVVRGYSPLKRLLPNLRQKTVEAYMGLWQSRTDEISGEESVYLYREYERTMDPALEKKILLHNRDDVEQLSRLLKVIDKCDFHEAMYNMGFPVKAGNRLLTVKDIRIGRNGFLIEGTQDRGAANFRCYELDGYDVEVLFDRSRGTFSIRMPLNWNRGLVVMDIRAAGLDEREFAAYPECGSGFLVIRGERDIRHRECNHLIRAYLNKLVGIIDGQCASMN